MARKKKDSLSDAKQAVVRRVFAAKEDLDDAFDDLAELDYRSAARLEDILEELDDWVRDNDRGYQGD